ncbi:hypothetical protein ANCCEY_10976 [Ancylostoma ceylanicum]|uniref:BAR domain-containing protein n=1 Tax=Ancylostoma ceylanicum TaxID=53326 RepID=A0A0D6LCX1_9BILA|nr:hypothetical protein ANCCEY_10976 [Ancylostoma ceylanicum]
MSLSGLRKQFNKANQYLSETMGAAEATKLDDQYNEMEKVLFIKILCFFTTFTWWLYTISRSSLFQHIDMTYELISALVAGTNEYLQPNPGESSLFFLFIFTSMKVNLK